jgi:UDP-N-acetylmuramoyl-L-alanyl-D-glutamate--2,6-diaminopimelate ligase
MLRRIKNLYHLIVAVLANSIFLFPARKLTVIGVTGTDGKTTTVNLIYHILKENGYKVSMLSSIGASIGNENIDTGFHVTTPSSFLLQKLLRSALTQKSEFFILEVTSHALDQNRVWGIPFKLGVITNVSNEHLDYHKTYEKYLKTKNRLLEIAEIAIVNRDDPSFDLISKLNRKSMTNFKTYGFSESADINLKNIDYECNQIFGEFNKYNILAAWASAKSLGVKEIEIKNAIKSFKLPLGRVDVVCDKNFTVIIDFAHTPNSFEQLLSSLRERTKGRLIHVFGSAGERDQIKRPLMGEISAKYSDIIILTSEDPRNEKSEDIIDEIASGIKSNKVTVLKKTDRKNAIEDAINMTKNGDLVVVSGKAHEKSMTFGNKEMPWDEYKVVKDAIKNKK